MPRKIRQLITDLRKAGFVNRGGKRSHRNFIHYCGLTITIFIVKKLMPSQKKLLS